jgi:hypothetical protein
VVGYIVDHYCLRFDRGVVHIAVAGYTSNNNGQQYNSDNNMNHSSVKHQTVMVNNITSHNNMNHCSVKHQTVMIKNITGNNNDRGVVHIVVAGYIVDRLLFEV